MMFVLGIGVRMYRQGENRVRTEYAVQDSVFRARSARPDAPDSARTPGTQTAGMAHRFPAKTTPHMVDVNHAPKEELVALPGIGDAMADRILAYRREHGPFHQIDDLRNVKGIGKKKLDRLAPYCILGR